MKAPNKEEVRRNTDFLTFYQQREGLRLGPVKANGDALACCVFHDDSNPSMNVNLQTGNFCCFSCDAKGDVFEFVQRRYNLPFAEAIDYVAGTPGAAVAPVALQKKKAAPQQEKPKRRKARIDLQNPSHIYPYCDPDGRIIYFRFRWDEPGCEKAIYPGYYTEDGELVLKMPPGVKPTLYNLQRADDYAPISMRGCTSANCTGKNRRGP